MCLSAGWAQETDLKRKLFKKVKMKIRVHVLYKLVAGSGVFSSSHVQCVNSPGMVLFSVLKFFQSFSFCLCEIILFFI